MGRLRTSFVSAMDYTKELIGSGENTAQAIHKAALKFNEDENQIKAKIEKTTSKPAKRGRKPKNTNNTEPSNIICYVGPIYKANKKNFDLVSVKATAGDNPKENIEKLISEKENVPVRIEDKDWNNFSRQFNDSTKCDKFIAKMSFNNILPFFSDTTTPVSTPIVSTQKYKINDKCADMVKEFNAKKKKDFKDYLMLKTFGNDGVSPLRLKDIKKQIPNDELIFAEGEMSNPNDLSTCLKWKLRGLSIEDAVEKVKVENMAKNR